MASKDPLIVEGPSAPDDAQVGDATRVGRRLASEDHWLVRDPVRTGFLLVLAISLAVRLNILRDSFFITDDFMLMSRAAESPLNWEYLGRVHTGHFEPVGFAVMWLLAHFAPWSWGAAVVVMMAGLLLVFVLVWRLLIEVFGRRRMTLVPFALFCFSPLILPATTWLSAAIIWIPLMASVAGATRHHVRFLRAGRTTDALQAVAWLVLGMLSFEKSLILLPYLVVLTLAVQPSISITRRGLWTALTDSRRIWTAYAVTTVVYVGVYTASLAKTDGRTSLVAPAPGQVWDFTYLSVFRTFVPAALGGPWRWQPVGYGGILVDSPRLFEWIALLLFAALLVATLATRRHMARHWAAIATYILFSVGVLVVGRVGIGGSVIGLETRYIADAAVPWSLLVGAGLMPIKGESNPWLPHATRIKTLWPSRQRLVAGLVALAAILVLSLNAMNSYASLNSASEYRPFVENVEESLRALPPDAEIYDTPMPVDVVGALFQDPEYTYVSRFLSPKLTSDQRLLLAERREFSHPYYLDSTGRFQRMKVEGVKSPPPILDACGWTAKDGAVVVPLQSAAFAWSWAVRIGYLSDGETNAVIRLADGEQQVHLKEGLGEVYVRLVGSGNEVVVDGMDPDVNVCIGDVQVGNPGTK